VKVALDVLMGKACDDQGSQESALWNAIRKSASEQGLTLAEHRIAVKSRAYPVFREAVLGIEHYEKAHFPGLTKTETLSLLSMFARAYVRWLSGLKHSIGLGVSTGVALRNSHNMIAQLEVQWPGGPEQVRFLLRGRQG
jgi:hypothetical protein